MSDDDPIHDRLATSGDPETRALIRAASAPPPLDPAALGRVTAHVAAARRTRLPALAYGAMVGTFLLGSVGGASASTWYQAGGRGGAKPAAKPGTAPATKPVAAPADIVAVTSGTRLVHRGAGPTQLLRGHVAIRTRATKAEIDTPDGRVIVAPKSLAEVIVRRGVTERVGAHEGTASLVRKSGATLRVSARRAFTTGGDVDSSDSRQAWLEGIVDGEDAALPPPETGAIEVEIDDRAPASPSGRIPARAQPSGGESWAIIDVEPEAEVQKRAQATFRRGLVALHQDKDPKRAAELFEEYAGYLGDAPRPLLAVAAQTEALRLLRRDIDALAVLEDAVLDTSREARALRLQRGILRSRAHRCPDAIKDFSAVLQGAELAQVSETALYERAVCRLRMGDRRLYRDDLRAYLERYPHGRFSAEVERRLTKPRPVQ